MNIRLSSGKEIPIEMHKVRILQKIRLASVVERLKALEEGATTPSCCGHGTSSWTCSPTAA